VNSALRLQVTVNGQARSVDAGATIETLLDALGVAGDGVAVAVNDEIVLRSVWSHARLRDHDRVEVLSATPGG